MSWRGTPDALGLGMPRPLFSFTPHAVYEIVSRTIQERFLLRPGLESRALVDGAIARGQELFPDVKVYGYCFLSDHFHLLASSPCGQQLVQCVGYIKGRVSTELGRLHNWRGTLWAGPSTYTEIVDDAALIERFIYVLAQGVKEGLVSSPRDWSGASAVPGLLGDMRVEGRVFDRDRETRARRRGKERTFARDVAVELSPLPPWAGLSRIALVQRHREIVEAIEQEARGRHVLGAAKVQAVDPHDRPRAPKRTPAPRCHASTARARAEYSERYRRGVDRYRVAADAYRAGASIAESGFPPGFFVNGPYCVQADGTLSRWTRQRPAHARAS
jgi:hypothetical protein